MPVIIIGVVCLIAAWCAWSFSWSAKQTLLGTWAADLPDGTRVTLQFEGERKGGTYKQLTRRGDKEAREFGHWIMRIVELRLIIMATDTKEHPRFGIDTKYGVNFTSEDRVTINGPDRPKWTLKRTADKLEA